MAKRRPIDERVVRLKSGEYLHEREFVPKGRFSRRGMYDTASMKRTKFVTVKPPGRPDVRLVVGCLPVDTTRSVCRRTTVQKSARSVSPRQASALRRRGVRSVRKNPSEAAIVAQWLANNPQLMVIGNPKKKRKVPTEGQIFRKGPPVSRAYYRATGAAWKQFEAGKIGKTELRRKLFLAARGAGAAMSKNPSLMVIANPKRKTSRKSSKKAPAANSTSAKLAGKAYKRFHFTGPAKTSTGWVPDGWPKAYITIGNCLRLDVKDAKGKKVVRNYSGANAPRVCTTAGMKDVYIFGNLKGIPSGTALRVDYRVPSHSKRRKWASDWTHDHDSRPRLTAHSSGKAIRISGKKLKVTPRGIEG